MVEEIIIKKNRPSIQILGNWMDGRTIKYKISIMQIDLNTNNFILRDERDERTYDLAETAKILGLSFGRNILYKILRLTSVIDYSNRPLQSYIDQGYFDRIVVVANREGPEKWKTLVIGRKGLDFVANVVDEYLKKNPVPKQTRGYWRTHTRDI